MEIFKFSFSKSFRAWRCKEGPKNKKFLLVQENENFPSPSSDGLKKCSAALGRCGIRFLIDWWRFQIDLSTPTTLKAQKHYFLMKFTRQNFRKIMDFLLFQILDCDFEGFKIIFRTSSCHERFLRGSKNSNIGSNYFFKKKSILFFNFEKRCPLQ